MIALMSPSMNQTNRAGFLNETGGASLYSSMLKSNLGNDSKYNMN
jgi:hypothetical protein